MGGIGGLLGGIGQLKVAKAQANAINAGTTGGAPGGGGAPSPMATPGPANGGGGVGSRDPLTRISNTVSIS